MTEYAVKLAEAGLKINAMKLNAKNPFQWASGFFMPIYNDNRMFLFYPEFRKLILDGFLDIIRTKKIIIDVIAGTSTAGIPHGTLLAEALGLPFIYIREKPKAHGLKNQIEGIDAEKDLEGKKIIVIEDLISTGGSSAKAVQAVREANGKVDYCLSIFSYNLLNALNEFAKLDKPCKVLSILEYDTLIDTAKKTGYISDEQQEALKLWRHEPFEWGEKRGFARIVKKQ
ncbi:MAG TPA: orotate phosphoribosyltransferase [Lentisphaeria bacterium]|nr:MAG: orotate phosphoribosyltransferase [Lentisphaerae bacterium GWF2_38_69]HBM16551.1 orotate phosphoribosyltransferase [Lentisphaeria bacterium]